MATAMIMAPEQLLCEEEMFSEEDLDDVPINTTHQMGRFPRFS